MTTEAIESPLSLVTWGAITPEDAPAMQGAYMVINLKTGFCYFGESNDVRRRLKRHRYELQKGRHYNKGLQASWNESLGSDFAFCALVTFGKEDPAYFRVGAQNRYIRQFRGAYTLNVERSKYILARLNPSNT